MKAILAQVSFFFENFVNLFIIVFIIKGLVTGGVMLSSASCGMPVGYSAILLPQLKNDNGTMGIDDETGSWIGELIVFQKFSQKNLESS